MLKEIKELEKLISKSLGLTKNKTNQVLNSILNCPFEEINKNIENFLSIIKKIEICQLCSNFSLNKTCEICSSKNRTKQLMIIENRDEIDKIEQTKVFEGKYFIVPLIFNKKANKINNFNFSFLNNYSQEFEEIIIAISPTIEGMLTTEEIIKNINHKNIKRIAFGAPIGVEINYLDSISLKESIKNRKDV